MITLPYLIDRKPCIVMMNKVPNSANMISQFLREGQGFSDQARNPLSEGTVKALDMIRLPGFLTNRSMAVGGDDVFVGRPKIGIADRALSINRWQRFPERSSALLASIPDMNSDDLARISVNG